MVYPQGIDPNVHTFAKEVPMLANIDLNKACRYTPMNQNMINYKFQTANFQSK